MRYMRMAGLCLAVVSIVMAAMAAGAQGKLPEWGKCEPTAEGTGGKYGNAGCTIPVKKVYNKYPGGYEWHPLPEHAKASLSYPSAGGPKPEQPVSKTTFTLAPSGRTVTCGPLRLEGQIPLEGPRLTKAPFFSFVQCADNEGEECRTTEASESGEIATTAPWEHGVFGETGSWNGTTRYIESRKGTEPVVGIVYKTEESRGFFVGLIVCEGEIHSIAVGGDKRNEMLTTTITPVNKMTHEYTATLRQSGGVQLPAAIERHPTVPLHAKVNSGEWETMGIEATMLFPATSGEGSSETGLELKATP